MKTFAILCLAICCSFFSLPDVQASAPTEGNRPAEMRRRARVRTVKVVKKVIVRGRRR